MRLIFLMMNFIVAGCLPICAQTTFLKHYGGGDLESPSSITQTSDSGFAIIGFTESFGVTNRATYIFKTNSEGALAWTKYFDFGASSSGYFVNSTSDGGLICSGAAINGAYILKINPNGDTAWTRVFNSPASMLWGAYVQQTNDSGYVLIGFNGNSHNCFILKTDLNGDTLWSEEIGIAGYVVGALSGQQVSDGGYILCGSAILAGDYKILLVKIDAFGSLVWSKTCERACYCNDQALEITETFDHGFIISGYANDITSGLQRALLIKTDFTGNVEWSKIFDFAGIDLGYSVEETYDSCYIFCGVTGSQNFLIKTNITGDTIFAKRFNVFGAAGNLFVKKTFDGGLIISGETHDTSGNNIDEIYLVKTNANGMSYCNEHSLTPVVSDANELSTVQSALLFPTSISIESPIYNISNGGSEGVICFSTGILQNPADVIALVPNPASHYFKINVFNSEIKAVSIFNIMGKETMTSAIKVNKQQDEITVNVSSLNSGIYFVKVETENGTSVQKLIKQ